MNKKGFTLVELIAIIAIIAIIALVAGPNISRQIQNESKQSQNVLNTKIRNAAKLYAAKYYADQIVSNDGASFSFTLADLERDGLLNLKDSECTSAKEKTINYEKGEDTEFKAISNNAAPPVNNCYNYQP